MFHKKVAKTRVFGIDNDATCSNFRVCSRIYEQRPIIEHVIDRLCRSFVDHFVGQFASQLIFVVGFVGGFVVGCHPPTKDKE